MRLYCSDKKHNEQRRTKARQRSNLENPTTCKSCKNTRLCPTCDGAGCIDCEYMGCCMECLFYKE